MKLLTGLFIFCAMHLCSAQLLADGKIEVSDKASWVKVAGYSTREHESSDVANGYYLKLLEIQVNVPEQAEYRHVLKKLENETGVQDQSQIQVRFDPSFQKIAFHHISIIRNGKKMNALKSSQFKTVKQETDLSRSVYNGTATALYILEDVRVGDELEYDYTITGFNPVMNGKYFENFYFEGSSTVGTVYHAILMPKDRKLYIRKFNGAPEASVSEVPGQQLTKYEWKIDNLKAHQDEDYEPDWYDAYRMVQVSEMNSWKEVADWALSINPDVSAISPALKATASGWKKESKTEQDYVQKCVRFVQDEIRYMGIEMSVYSHKPHLPDQVYMQRYGDCKDKSLLLCALLRAGNITAVPVYINTNKRKHTEELLPSPLDFDHCVSLIQLNNKDLWVDPTISLQRGPVSEQYFPNYQKGLVLRQGETELTTIPEPKSGKMIVYEKFHINDIDRDGFLEVKTEYTGGVADNTRNNFQALSHDELQKSCLDFYSKLYDSIFVESQTKYTDDPDKNILTLYESYRIKQPWKNNTADTMLYAITLYPEIIKERIQVLPKAIRLAPLKIIYPYSLQYTIEGVTPIEWEVKDEHKEVNNKAFRYTYTKTKNAKGFSIFYTYNTLSPDISPSDIPAYNRDVDSLYNDFSYQVSWNKAIDENTPPSFRLNFSFVLIAIMALLACAYIGIKVFRKSIYPLSPPAFTVIGGWMILPLIGLFLTPLKLLYHLGQDNYFNEARLLALKTNAATADQHWDIFILFELIGNLALLSLTILCLICFLKKRDITPRLMVTFYLYNFTLVVTDAIIAYSFDLNMDQDTSTTLLRSIVAVAIWVPFFLKSSRVKETFIVPYGGFTEEETTTETEAPTTGEMIHAPEQALTTEPIKIQEFPEPDNRMHNSKE